VSVENSREPDTGASDFLWEVHHYTNEYIRFADTKAAFIAGTATALIGSLFASSVFDSCFRTVPCLWSKTQWVGILGLLLLAISLTLSIVAIRPRLWNPTSVGFVFWDSITGHGTARHFTQEVHKLSDTERSAAVSNHLFVLATIAKRKYSFVDYALCTWFVGGILAGVVLFLQHAWR
jgi:hypothetical protein